MYEDTSGLTVGDLVYRTGKPLSVELGPGLMTQIYDGIQRPLKTIAKLSGDVFIPRGVDVHALDTSLQWEFNPTKYKVCHTCPSPVRNRVASQHSPVTMSRVAALRRLSTFACINTSAHSLDPARTTWCLCNEHLAPPTLHHNNGVHAECRCRWGIA